MYSLEGEVFTHLTVLKKDPIKTGHHTRWICKCGCGKEKSVLQSHLLRGNTRSCGCLQKRRGAAHPNSKMIGEMSGHKWAQLKRNSSHRMRRKKLAFTITHQEVWDLYLKQDRKCALTGTPISFGNHGEETTASLDRIDPLYGYTSNNIQWVHKQINFMKGTLQQQEFIDWCRLV